MGMGSGGKALFRWSDGGEGRILEEAAFLQGHVWSEGTKPEVPGGRSGKRKKGLQWLKTRPEGELGTGPAGLCGELGLHPESGD